MRLCQIGPSLHLSYFSTLIGNFKFLCAVCLIVEIRLRKRLKFGDSNKKYFRELFTRTKLDRGSIKMFEQIQVSAL